MKSSLLDEIFLQVILRISINKDIYDRTYMKVQEALANVGGIVKIVFTIGEVLNYLTKLILYRNYILQFFNLDFFKAIKANNKKSIKYKSIASLPPLIITNKNLLNLNSDKIEIRDYIQINNSNIHLKFSNNTSLPKNQSLQDLFSIKNKNAMKLKRFNLNNSNNNKTNDNNIINNKNNNSSIFYTDYNFKVNKYYLYDKVVRRNIRKYHSIIDILLKKGACKQIFLSLKRFQKISFLFEISRYIKNINETNLLKNLIFDEKQNKLLAYIYHFDYVFEKEKLNTYKNTVEFRSPNGTLNPIIWQICVI